MRFPVVAQTKLPSVAHALLDDPDAGVEDRLEWSGTGSELDMTGVEDAATALEVEFADFLEGPHANDPDRFEGRVGAVLHETLSQADVPPVVLDEPGFWAYLTVRYFWWFVTWRQASTFDGGDFGNYRRYIDGTNHSECVLLRAYLRAHLAHQPESEEPYRLASAIPHGTDFWRSHVLRVQTGSSPTMTQAFAAEQLQNRMNTDPLRSYARRLNRMWTNVVLHVYDDDEAEALISELR